VRSPSRHLAGAPAIPGRSRVLAESVGHGVRTVAGAPTRRRARAQGPHRQDRHGRGPGAGRDASRCRLAYACRKDAAGAPGLAPRSRAAETAAMVRRSSACGRARLARAEGPAPRTHAAGVAPPRHLESPRSAARMARGRPSPARRAICRRICRRRAGPGMPPWARRGAGWAVRPRDQRGATVDPHRHGLPAAERSVRRDRPGCLAGAPGPLAHPGARRVLPKAEQGVGPASSRRARPVVARRPSRSLDQVARAASRRSTRRRRLRPRSPRRSWDTASPPALPGRTRHGGSRRTPPIIHAASGTRKARSRVTGARARGSAAAQRCLPAL
jgi:hypothetical protein